MGRPAHGSDNFRFTNPRKLNANDSVTRALRFSVRICPRGVREWTAQPNLPHIKSCRMWRLVLASVMLIPRPGRKNMSFVRDLRVAAHSLIRTPGLAIAVVLTLALGIGANAAIFTLVRGVLLKPLVNRGEDRLIYVRQSAPGIGEENAAFSVPELKDIGTSLKTIQELGTFSEIDFTVVGLGTPREIPAGVVDGNYFEVMGLKPILGRVL